MNAQQALQQTALEANWSPQLQLAWTQAFLGNLNLRQARLLAIRHRFELSAASALAALSPLLTRIDAHWPDGSFPLYLSEVLACEQALAASA